MRRTAFIAAAVVAAVVRPGLLWADADSINGILSGNLSATDNAFSANGNKQADIYAQLRPGLLFGYATPRAIYTASIEGEVLDYVINYKQLAVNVRASGSAGFTATKFTDVGFTVTASTGKLNALSGRLTPDQTTTNLVPAGGGNIYQVDGGQSLSHVLSPSVRFSQSLGGNFVQTSAGGGALSRSMQGNLGIALGKSFEGNAVGFDLGVGFVRFLQYNPGDPANGVPLFGRLDHQLTPHAGVSWRHDISRKWSTGLGVGLGGIVPVGTDPYNPARTGEQPVVAPSFNGTLSYVDTWGFANLVAGHELAPNLLIAQNTISDSATVNVAIPLVFIESRGQPPRYTLSGSGGYTHQKLVDTMTSGTVGSFSGEHVDIGVAYLPRPSQAFSLRYSFAHQTGDPTAVIPIPSLTTNTVSFTFSLRYPERIRVAPPKRQSVRADESDLQPFGQKPAEDDPGVGGNTKPKSDE